MGMKTKQIGSILVPQVVELENLPIEASSIFPGFHPAMAARGREWLDQRFIAPNSDTIYLSFHSFVIQSGGRNILVDTCHGNDKHGREGTFTYYNGLQTDYLANLARFGLRPEDIDVVLCTHLHFDHVGWNTRLENGRWVPTFPNARYLMSKVDFDHFGGVEPDSHDAMHILSYQDSVLPVVVAGQADFIHLDRTRDHDLGPDMWLEAAPGHTAGSVVLHARNDSGGALFSGDCWHHPLQFAEPSLSLEIEQDVAASMATRRRLLESCVDANTLVMAAHFPSPTAGRVISHGDGLRFQFTPD
jgi:glyoxylase-like metal-dependent hydrolase (beta-lactamase superfamily II)